MSEIKSEDYYDYIRDEKGCPVSDENGNWIIDKNSKTTIHIITNPLFDEITKSKDKQ